MYVYIYTRTHVLYMYTFSESWPKHTKPLDDFGAPVVGTPQFPTFMRNFLHATRKNPSLSGGSCALGLHGSAYPSGASLLYNSRPGV
jgi:hypothetical protein